MFPTTLVILVLGLVVATCIIAYWADNLGKKLGKKRISLLGLRPRQTATLISMVSSVAIMLLTLLIISLFSASVRNALTKYEQVRKDNNLLAKNVRQLRSESEELRQSAAENRQTAKEAELQAKAASKRAEKARQDADSAEAGLKKALFALNSANQARNRAEAREREARRAETLARKLELSSRERLKEASRRLASAEEKLGSVNNRLASARNSLAEANIRLQEAVAAGKRLQKGNMLLTRSNAVLIRKEATLRADLAQKEQGVRVLEQQSRDLTAQVEKARRDLEIANEELETANREYIRIRDQALIWQTRAGLIGQGLIKVGIGHVYAEGEVQPEASPEEIRILVRGLLREGAVVAEKLGGQAYSVGENEPSSALHLALARVSGTELIGEEEQIDLFASYVSRSTVPVSVRLIAPRDYAQDETELEAQLVAVPIRKAFTDGETIQSLTIDGRETDANLFNALLKLVNTGEGVARSRGVTPLKTEANPDYYANDTNEQIFDALRSIQMRSRLVRVRMVADGDILTTDNVRVRFLIEPV